MKFENMFINDVVLTLQTDFIRIELYQPKFYDDIKV